MIFTEIAGRHPPIEPSFGVQPSRMSNPLSKSKVLDGYRLVRFLGRGGFGEVWLCRSESMGDFRALKFIPAGNSDQFEKEYQALLHYRKAAAKLRSPHLVPIEHVNRNGDGLYYVMPLADGDGTVDPADPVWQPVCLAARIHERVNVATWFSSREIIDLLLPVLEALQTLSDAGLVHRDVKPENILFIDGQPCLGDISLLGADASVITRRGTPGYGTPSWYLGGHPDMYGAAATLFTLLTGNLPDRMGRAAFLWPPQGEDSLSAGEQAEWKRLHAVIRRATEELVAERFVDFRTMAKALSSVPSVLPPPLPPEPAPTEEKVAKPQAKKKRPSSPVMITIGVMLFLFWLIGYLTLPPDDQDSEADATNPIPSVSARQDERKPTDASDRRPGTSQRLDDAYVAHSALSTVQMEHYTPVRHVDAADDEVMSNDENNLYQDMLIKMHGYLWDETDPDFPAAVQVLEACIEGIPQLKKRPNIQLAHLLLQRCADEHVTNPALIDDPSLLILGNDDLGYRVALLTSLGAETKADEFLGNFIARESRTSEEKSDAFVRRARVRAMLGRFDEAKSDADEAIAAASENSVLTALRQSDIQKLARDIPAYADYLKKLAEK